jgi:cephalosporin hydroxylase
MTVRVDLAEVAAVACSRYAASQAPDELGEALEVVAALDPRVIVEIGCDAGGTLYAWRQICDAVYGITLSDNSHDTGGSNMALADHGATVRFGDSHDLASLEWLTRQLEGRSVDALILDGDHTVDGVTRDLAMYAPFVRPGGLILLHDIAVTTDHRAEVFKVWPELAGRWETSEIRSPIHAYGWGVIHVGGRSPWHPDGDPSGR